MVTGSANVNATVPFAHVAREKVAEDKFAETDNGEVEDVLQVVPVDRLEGHPKELT